MPCSARCTALLRSIQEAQRKLREARDAANRIAIDHARGVLAQQVQRILDSDGTDNELDQNEQMLLCCNLVLKVHDELASRKITEVLAAEEHDPNTGSASDAPTAFSPVDWLERRKKIVEIIEECEAHARKTRRFRAK